MPNSFSTFFESKLTASVVNSISYELIVGSLNCSNEMTDLPRIIRESGKIISENTPISLMRSDAIINSLDIRSYYCFNLPVAFNWGFVTDSGTSDTARLLTGLVSGIHISDETIELNVVDKNESLANALCTSSSQSTTMTPSALWWHLMTDSDNMGLSDVESSSNPDIDYDTWKEWSDFNDSEPSSYHVRLTRNYVDQYALDMQEKLMMLASATVFHDGAGRLVPVGWNKRVSEGSLEITDSEIIGDIETLAYNDQMVNKVQLGYHDDDAKKTAIYQDSTSISSWGMRAVDIDTFGDDIEVYEVTILEGENAGDPAYNCPSLCALRMVNMVNNPHELIKYKIKTNISGIKYLPEDAITLVTSRDNLVSRDLTIKKIEYDLNTGTVKINLIGRSKEPS